MKVKVNKCCCLCESRAPYDVTTCLTQVCASVKLRHMRTYLSPPPLLTLNVRPPVTPHLKVHLPLLLFCFFFAYVFLQEGGDELKKGFFNAKKTCTCVHRATNMRMAITVHNFPTYVVYHHLQLKYTVRTCLRYCK